MIRHLILIGCAVVAAAPLAACGKQGELERPAPMWGARARAEYEAQQREQADRKAREAQGNQIESLPDEGAGAVPNTNPAPPRTQPLPGARQDPFTPAPQGVLPDPYARPQ